MDSSRLERVLHTIDIRLADSNTLLTEIRDLLLMIGSRLPAPIDEDASGSTRVMAHAEIPGDYAYPQDDPVADAPIGAHDHHDDVTGYPASPEDTCYLYHTWEDAELNSETLCEKCGIRYREWSKE